MTVTAVHKDPAALTMTLEAEFDASPDRVWQLWADPRQLERWWGPPTYPATVTSHDLRPHGRVEYHMTGPEGDQPHGYWEIIEVDPPRRLIAPRRLRQRRRHAQHRHAAQRGAGPDHRARRWTDADVHRERPSPTPPPWSSSWPWAWTRA